MENNLQNKKNQPNWWLLTLALLCLTTGRLAAQDFTQAYSMTGVYESSVAWGDYDNDGDLDILLTGYTGSGRISKIYRNTGTGFAEAASLPGVEYGSVAWGDYDNDGDLDVLLTGYVGTGDSIFKVYRNTGSGFTEAANLPGVYHSSAAWGDYDNDGDLDVVLTGTTNGAVSGAVSKVYRNTGTGFSEVTGLNLPGVSYGSVAWGDYDNDGDLDILLTGKSKLGDRISTIYRNTGTGFSEVAGLNLPGVEYGSVAWGDYDNDGDLDILLAGTINGFGDTVSKVYRNTGTGFSEVTGLNLPGVSYGSVAWGDYDNDGDLDILLTGAGSGVTSKVYRNTGTGFAEVTGLDLTGVNYSSAAWGDYDSDGDLDILLTGNSFSGTVSRVYRNNITTANTAPVAPSGLGATVTGGTARLTWNRTTDTETPQAGLTYNLRIGTTPGGNEVLSSMASAAGARKLPKLGNVNHYTTTGGYEVKNLAPGTYYWSVQAVDGAFAGSAFAAEQQFTVANAVPELATIDAQSAVPQTELAFTVTATDADLPAQTLTFSLVGAPTGAAINATSGAFSWTPTEAQGGASYTFTVVVSDGIATDEEQITVEVATVTGIADAKASKLLLYPNPAENVLYIELQENAIVEVFSVTGKLVSSKTLKAGTQAVNVAALAKGQYMLRVTGNKSVTNSKFIKK